MTNRFEGSGRPREGGFSATHKQDFVAHVTGGDWRHTGDQIDMNPPIDTSNFVFEAPTVQETLQKFATYLNQIGHGYVTIGDGYDISASDFEVAPGTTAQQAFLDAFDHPRLANGGVVLVKAGTYRLTQTVNVPAGITILGEPSGTYVFGSMSEQPMFKCLRSTKQFQLGSISGNEFNAILPSDLVTFSNIILGDNLDGYSVDGFGRPKATMSTVPMIQLQHGANVVLDRVSLLGRLNNTFPPAVITKRAVGLDNSTTSNEPTTLHAKDCYIDGVSQGIFFDARNGSIDNVRVDKCKIRTYGGATAEEGSAVSFNLCNAHFEGNYHLAGGLGATTGFYLRNISVVSTTDVKVNIVNNSGGISDSALLLGDINSFFTNASSYTVEGVNVGNSWGQTYSPWVVTVGDGANSVGDLSGPNAINILLEATKLSAAITNRIDLYAVVGYGSYTVTAGGTNGKLNLLGKTRNGAYPVLNLNSGSGTDSAGNPTTGFGGQIENIKFTTDSGAVSYNTVTLIQGQTTDSTQLNKHHVVRNCLFSNAGLIAQQFTRSTNEEMNSIVLENCKFNQTGTFANNFSFLLPISADSVYLRNVVVHDKGYVGGIGDVSGVYTGTAPPESVIVLEGCLFDQNIGLTTAAVDAITAASPLTNKNHYFWINNSRAKVFIKDTTITCADDLSSVLPSLVVTNGLPGAGTFQKYTSFQARDISFINSSVIGPNQAYISGGVSYLMPAVWVEPRQTLIVDGCKLKGALAMQISGTSQFNQIDQAASISLSNTNFMGFAGVSSVSTCALDIDAISFTAGSAAVYPHIAITNCNVDNRFDSTNTNGAYPEHVNNVTTNYTTLAISQIYAAGWNVRISNSKFTGNLGTSLPSGFDSLACLYVDVLTALTATLTDAFVLISNNSIKYSNNVNTGTGVTTCVWTEAVRLQFNNNSVNFVIPSVTGGTNTRNYMYIKAQSSADDGSIVSNNTFARSGSGNLNLSAITIASTQGKGAFINNDFDDATLDGSSTALISDAATVQWRKEQNRNQTIAYNGLVSMGTPAMVVAGSTPVLFGTVAFASQIRFNTSPVFRYASGDAATEILFAWYLCLEDILPKDVTVLTVDVTVSRTGNAFNTTGDFLATLSSVDGGSVAGNTINLTSVASGTSTVTGGANFRTSGVNKTLLTITLNANGDANNRDVSITAITITYRW